MLHQRSRVAHDLPQRSILGSLLFNIIDLIDLFYECEESNIASYADDITPCSCQVTPKQYFLI